MKKFLAVLMVLVLSASLLAGAMAGEYKTHDYNDEDKLTGHIGLYLNLIVDDEEKENTEYEAEPVWNIVISEDYLCWDVTRNRPTEKTDTQKLKWNPEMGAYDLDGDPTSSDSAGEATYTVSTTPKDVKLTNRSNFNVTYSASGTSQFKFSNATGELTLAKKDATITVTPDADAINKSITAVDNGDDIITDKMTVYSPGTGSFTRSLSTEKETLILSADIVFTRSSELFPFDEKPVNQVENTETGAENP